MRTRTTARWALAAAMAVAAVRVLAQQDEGPILRPKTPPAKSGGPTLVVMCDLACNWTLDGKGMGKIGETDSKRAPVSPGHHLVAAVTLDGLDKVEN